VGVGWRTSGLDALQRGIGRKNGVKGTNQERRRFYFKAHSSICVWSKESR